MSKFFMPTDPAQLTLAAFELGLLLAGVLLVLRLTLSHEQRTRWLGTNALRNWAITLPEFALFLVIIFLTGFTFQASVQAIFGNAIAKAPDREGLQLFAYGAAFHGGGLVGWLLFPSLRRKWYADYGVDSPSLPPAETPLGISWDRKLLYGAGTLLVAMPVLIVLSLGWTTLLRQLGLPDEQQDLIAVFANTRSPAVISGMFIVACVLAPLNEEFLFRAGVYRFCRQKLGRGWALLISGCCFGALHGNWAGFVPLAALGMVLALAYEATGSIRVAVVAHGLFNLNTILIVLSGLEDITS